MATKTWEITNLTRDVRDGYVYVIEFEVTATEGAEEIGKTRGEVAFMLSLIHISEPTRRM